MDGFLREREDGQLAWNAPLQHRLRGGVESHASAVASPLSSDVACRIAINIRAMLNLILFNRYDPCPQGAKQCNSTDFNAH